MVTERSSKAFDTIRIRGNWWIPGSADEPRKVPGELTFEVGAGGTLELYEALSEECRGTAVIHGLGADGECVTIFNAYTIQTRRRQNSVGIFHTETIHFFDMWVGNHWFGTKDAVLFKEYSFGIHAIEFWAEQNCFTTPRKLARNKTSVSFKAPKPILLFSDDRMEIKLDSAWSGPSSSFGQVEGCIQYYPRIVIRSKEELLPYYGEMDSISACEWSIFVLIALLMGVDTWKFGFEGIVKELQIKPVFSDEVSVRHYVQHDWGKVDASRRPHHDDILIPYSGIKSRFHVVSARFFALNAIVGSPIAVLYRMQCVSHAFFPSTLPELLFAFEELEKKLLGKDDKKLAKKEKGYASMMQKKLQPFCSEKELEWLKPKLAFHGLSFSQRCQKAFREMKDIYPELGTDLAKPLINYLRKTRNDYAHAASSTSDDHTLYVYTSHWLAEFMTLMILRACGVSAKKIKEVFFREWGPDHGKTKRFFTYIQKEVAAGRLK